MQQIKIDVERCGCNSAATLSITYFTLFLSVIVSSMAIYFMSWKTCICNALTCILSTLSTSTKHQKVVDTDGVIQDCTQLILHLMLIELRLLASNRSKLLNQTARIR